MKIHGFLLLLSPMVMGQIDINACAVPAINIGTRLTSLTQTQLQTICTDDAAMREEIAGIRTILVDCGLAGWASRADDLVVGTVVQGLFNFIEDFLCSSKTNAEDGEAHYCFPHAVQLINPNDLFTFFARSQTSEEPFEWRALVKQITCDVLRDSGNSHNRVPFICPSGGRGSGEWKCKKAMITKFDRMVLRIRNMLRGGLIESTQNVRSLVSPLLGFASNVRLVCQRCANEAQQWINYECDANAPEPEWCVIDAENSYNNRVHQGYRTLLNNKRLYSQQLRLRDDTIVDLDMLRERCCGEDCQSNQNMRKMILRQRIIDLTAEFGGNDYIIQLWQLLNEHQKQEFCRSLCEDVAASGCASFDPRGDDCIVSVNLIDRIVEGSRGLLQEEQHLVATMTINGMEGEDITDDCDETSSFFRTNYYLNMTNNTIGQDQCSDDAIVSSSTGGYMPDDGSSSKLSFSLMGILCNMFIVVSVYWL